MENDNILYDLELEKVLREEGEDFVPNEFEWLTLDEQKIKTKELEEISKE